MNFTPDQAESGSEKKVIEFKLTLHNLGRNLHKNEKMNSFVLFVLKTLTYIKKQTKTSEFLSRNSQVKVPFCFCSQNEQQYASVTYHTRMIFVRKNSRLSDRYLFA